MKNKFSFNKGALVLVEYRSPNNAMRRSVGVVLELKHDALRLGHNFMGITPIDISRIPLEDVLNVTEVTPKEIDGMEDFCTISQE
jgi:hypothetical protein